MNIELTINEIGYIISSVKKDGILKYISYKNILSEIETIYSNYKNIYIENNIIIVESNFGKLTINNYENNKEVFLNSIINKLTEIKLKERKDFLRNKKIKRISFITGAVVISVGLMAASFLKDFDEDTYEYDLDNDIGIENIDEECTTIENDKQDKDENINEKENYIKELDYIANNEIQKENIVSASFISRTDTEKYINTKDNYQEIISNISYEYGIDPKIMLAIATQESGNHIIDNNIPGIGLMQIERSVWNNQTITAYNYSTKQLENIKITEEKLNNLEFNIKIACMHFQNCLINSNYNLDVAIQMYNFGYGNIEKVLQYYHNNSNISLHEALNNFDNEWLNYRNYINEGDNMYLEHILSYIENPEEVFCMNNNEIIQYKVVNNEYRLHI